MKSINYTMAVGAVTSKIIFNMLSENGVHEAALRTAINTEEPSIGYWWKRWNATTCYEAFPAANDASSEFPCSSALCVPLPAARCVPLCTHAALVPHIVFVFALADSHGTLNHVFLCGGIGHWMWKHLVGLTPAAPGFAKVSLRPRIHDSVGPRAVSGRFLSPKGTIASSWKISGSAANVVELSVSLPVGVQGATIVVPKPTSNGVPSKAVTITLGGKEVWDGTKLVGAAAGIQSAADGRAGVTFETTNGVFDFASKVPMPGQ